MATNNARIGDISDPIRAEVEAAVMREADEALHGYSAMMTVDEVAEVTGYAPRTVRAMAARGDFGPLPHHGGYRWRIPRAIVRRYLAGKPVASQAQR